MRAEIEWLRVIAAFGIAWFHGGELLGQDIAYGGLIFFVITSSFYTMRSTRDPSLRDRATRLLIPFAFWFAVYAASRMIGGRTLFPDDLGWLSRILTSPSLHLWYLPFIFMVTVSVDFVRSRFAPGVIGWFASAAAIVGLWSMILSEPSGLPVPFVQYMHALPAVFLGLFLATVQERTDSRLGHVLNAAVCLSVLAVFFADLPGRSMTYLSGTLAATVLVVEKPLMRQSAVAETLGAAAFGTYLAHPLVISAFLMLGMEGASSTLLAFLVTIVGVVVVKRVFPEWLTRVAA
jgi:peptidoglycan/LPS O-acetylase OafA/YrhL